MEAFLGSWKMVSSEGFDEVMKRLGVSYTTRKAAEMLKPKFVVDVLPDGKYNMRSESKFKNTEVAFNLGEKFDETTPDGRKVVSVVTLEDGVLKQKQENKEHTTYIERVVEGATLRTTVKVDELVSVRTYTKVT